MAEETARTEDFRRLALRDVVPLDSPTQGQPAVARLLAIAVALCTVSTAWADPWFAPAASSLQPHPAVARIVAPERDGTAYGSGTLVAVNESSGLILTNWHVVRDAAGPLMVVFPDGFRSGAVLLRTDRDWDLAALAIRRPNIAPVAVATAAPRPGESLTIAGYGSGSYRAVSGACTQYVSPGGDQPFEMIELSAPARQGDSGGPILNDRGELAGVLFGSAFGRTTGSYCGRLRWFLKLAQNDFERISAQALLAQQQARGVAPPVASISATGVSHLPMGEGSGVRAGVGAGSVVRSAVADGSGTRAGEAAAATHPPALSSCASLQPSPSSDSAATTLSPPAASLRSDAPAGPLPTGDQIKTILAGIGILAVLYYALRMLGWAVG